MSITANAPGLPDDNQTTETGTAEQFGTVNPATLAQPKIDDRGARIPAQRSAEPVEQPSSCPRPWCPHDHTDDLIVGESDRSCGIDAPGLPGGEMRLRHHHGIDTAELGTGRLFVGMFQGVDEIAPRITIGTALGKGMKEPDWLVLTRDEAELFAQRLGLLCDLGEVALPTTPARGRKPFWQVTECPVWCDETHKPADQYPNRHHSGDASMDPMGLLLMDANGDDPAGVELSLIQHYRSTVAVLDVARVNARGWLRMSMGEARELSRHLLDLVTLADSDTAQVTR